MYILFISIISVNEIESTQNTQKGVNSGKLKKLLSAIDFIIYMDMAITNPQGIRVAF
ncbi:MAG TPA: hypothetical protein VHY08_18655 [Bacillota bacterium]|nr:hypothetical protein [Bacillota bacterium]